MDHAQAESRKWGVMLAELFKLRLTFLVLLTCLVGFYLGSVGDVQLALLVHTVLGTALLASGAAALNQYLEREWDAKMERTASRPLPAGELSPATALNLGVAVSSVGMIYLALAVNPLTSVLGALTLLLYLLVYTPLKRKTPLNTIVGAIPGALPPLMGWTGARDAISIEGWSLFAILFFWQLPHFLAIAWIYRDEYRDAGYRMLPSVDPSGKRTGGQAISHTLGLLPVSLSPVVFGKAGGLYFASALILGAFFVYFAVRFAQRLDRAAARKLFFWSIIYLPALLILMLVDARPV